MLNKLVPPVKSRVYRFCANQAPLLRRDDSWPPCSPSLLPECPLSDALFSIVFDPKRTRDFPSNGTNYCLDVEYTTPSGVWSSLPSFPGPLLVRLGSRLYLIFIPYKGRAQDLPLEKKLTHASSSYLFPPVFSEYSLF